MNNVVVPIPTFERGAEGVERAVAFLRSLEAAGHLESLGFVACLSGGEVATVYVEREQGDRYRLSYGATTLGLRVAQDPE